MRLTHLQITQFPGISSPREYTFEGLITVLHGPNASGKTSSARAIFALFDSRIAAGEHVHVQATFVDDHHEYVVQRIQDTIRWHTDGKHTARPAAARDIDINSHFLTVKNLLSTAETERELEQHVLTELTGGVDLLKIERQLTNGSRSAGQREAATLRGATKRVQELITEREHLAEQELQLESQRERLAAKRAKLAEESALKLASNRAKVRANLKRHNALRATLPPVEEVLTPDRIDNLVQQMAAIDEKVQRMRAIEREREALEVKIGNVPKVRSAVKRLHTALDIEDRLEKLRTKESNLASTFIGLVETLKRRREAMGEYSTEPISEQLRAANLQHTLTLIERVDQHAAELTALRTRAKLAQNELREATTADTAELHTTKERLAQWLVTQPAGISAAPTVLAWVVVALCVGALWLAWPVTVAPLSMVAGLVGIGALATAVATTVAFRRDVAVRRARNEIAATLHREIHDEADAGEWFTEVHESLAKAQAAADRNHQLRTYLAVIEQDIAQATEAHQEAFAVLCTAIGYEPQSIPSVINRVVKVKHELEIDELFISAEAARAELDSVREQIAVLTAKQAELVQPFNFTVEVGKRMLEMRLEMERDLGQKRQELSRLGREQGNLFHSVKDDRFEVLDYLRDIGVALPERFSYFEIPDLLKKQQANWPAFAEWQEAYNDFTNELAYLEQSLADYPAVLALSEEEVSERLHNIPIITEQADGLHATISRTEVALETAKRQRAIERAREEEQRAQQELIAHQQGTLADTAVKFVVADVIRTSYEEQEPRTLARAAEWFSAFTNGAFELRYRPVQHDEAASALLAWDTHLGVGRTLAELSSGTLSQLLLAARIGFALEREAAGELVMPFVLDEALGTADNERFHAVARSLHLFSNETGRQLLYLSARDEDVQAWQHVNDEVHIITLPQEG